MVWVQRPTFLAPRPEDHLLKLIELVLELLDFVDVGLDFLVPFLDVLNGCNERLDEFFARGVCELFGGRSHDIKDGSDPLFFL
jgi:hypothetical protein